MNFAPKRLTIGGLTPLVQVRDAYCGSRRFSVVWCETSRYRLKVYYSFCLFDDQELIPSTLPIARTPSEEIGFTTNKVFTLINFHN